MSGLDRRIETGIGSHPGGEPSIFLGVTIDGEWPIGVDGFPAIVELNSLEARLLASLLVRHADMLESGGSFGDDLPIGIFDKEVQAQRHTFRIIKGELRAD